MFIPGIHDPGAQLDMAVSLCSGTGRLSGDESLLGAVHVHLDGGDPVDGALVGHHHLVRALLDVRVSKVQPVSRLVKEWRLRSNSLMP